VDMEVLEAAASSSPSPTPTRASPQHDRIERLEELVAELRRELDELKDKLGD
jgi:hypothetical protein